MTPTASSQKSNIYLTAAEVAALTDCSVQWIRDLAEAWGAISINGQQGGSSGQAYRFPLHHLPAEVQAKYHSQQEDKKQKKTAFELAAQHRKDTAEERKLALERWHECCSQNKAARKEELYPLFAERFLEYRPGFKMSLKTLYRWDKAYRDRGMDGLLEKEPSRPDRHIHPEAWQRFCDMYLTPNRISISHCYDLVEIEGADKGWWLPSLQHVARMVKRDIPFPVICMRRYGMKHAYDNAAPYTRRDAQSISSGEVWVGDHHVLDLMVWHEKRWVRPWLTAWLDMRSRKFVGWTVTVKPCTDTIMSSFARGALEPAIGLPREIYIDNGRDYCSYKFAGRGARERTMTDLDRLKLVEEGQRTQSLMYRLDIDVHFAIVENARAKVIERAFRDVVEHFSKLYPTYCGRIAKERPENHSELLKKLDGSKLTLEHIRKDLDKYLKEVWNKTPSAAGKGRKAESPDETFARTRLPVRSCTVEAMRFLFMKSTNPRKVGRNGITFRGNEYYNFKFLPLRGKSVYIRYNEDDLSKVYVYSTKDEYLGTAEMLQELPAIHADPELLAAEMKRKADAMNWIKNHELVRSAKKARLPTIDDVIESMNKARPRPADPQPTKVVEMVNISSEVNRSARIMKAANSGCDIDIFEAMLKGTPAEGRRKRPK